jgi:hypothetical protein
MAVVHRYEYVTLAAGLLDGDTNVGGPATLATFFPRRESSPTEGTLFQQADLRNSVYNELNGDLTGRTENALDLAALIVWHAVTVLLDRSSHPDLEIFRIFDEAIGMLVRFGFKTCSIQNIC